MKVITEKGGIKARSVNDRSIEHSISQKTELSKKNEKELSGKTERTIRRSEKDEPAPSERGKSVQNRPPAEKHKPKSPTVPTGEKEPAFQKQSGAVHNERRQLSERMEHIGGEKSAVGNA